MSEYVGRFAPTPSGPLHLGSLLTAVASFLDARANNGQWLLRIDDLDPPRIVDGSEAEIVNALEAHGLIWDGDLHYASARQADYDDALRTLAANNELFYCNCSRKRLPAGPYPGTCRRFTQPRDNCAIRLRVQPGEIHFEDRLNGPVCEDPAGTGGDMIIRRRDGLIGYQLAVVVDDAADGVTDVVRGADLLDNTARQIYIANRLSLPVPRFLHLPTIDNRHSQKLSKQAHALAIDPRNARLNLCWMLDLLGLQLPPGAARKTPTEILNYGTERWRRQGLSNIGSTQFIGF